MTHHFFQPYFPATPESDKENGFTLGYYLVRQSDGKRFFISKVVDVVALEEVASANLNKATGYEYWVDRSIGKDIQGNAAWMNQDFSERFF